MRVTLDVPEDIARVYSLGAVSLECAVLEGLAAEGYRNGLLSETQIRRLLSLPSRFAVHEWLRDRRIPYRYTQTDLSNDLATLSELGLR